MRRFNCLEKDLALFGNHFIEASAGTGKTFAMEHVVCRLLLASDLPIREILVVTFTRAATRELTGRIAETLRSALKQLKGDKVSFPYLEELVGDQTAQLRLERALRTFDESQIFTIHAFCYKMLLEFPFESGLDVSHSNPDEMPYEKVMEEAIADFFRNDVRLPSYHACQLEAVLSMARGSFSRLMGLVAGLVLRDITLPKMLSWDVAIEKCEELCRSLPHGFLSEFEAYASRFKGVCDISGRPRAEFQELAEKIEAGDASFLSGETALFSLLSRDNLKKGKEFPPSGALRCAVEAFLPLIEQVRDPKAILLRMVADARPNILQALKEKGIMPPDQLLSAMREKLDVPTFFECVAGKYQVAIVDEFQDTDKTQWTIFKQLFLDRKCQAFYLVGDPKQSIYGFRSADLATYFSAQEAFGLENLFSLTTNFRSEPALIEALNGAFDEEMAPEWMGKMRYSPVESCANVNNTSFPDTFGALHLPLFPAQKGREKQWPTKRVESDAIFPYVASEIAKLKVDGNFAYSDFAVLIKDRFQATRLETFLKGCGIPVQTKGVTHIASTRMYALFEKILAIAFDPRDISSIKQVLGSPFAHYTYVELTGELEKERAQFARLAQVMEESGFAAFVSSFLEAEFNGMKVLHHLISEDDLSDYADFIHLSDLLMEKAMHGYGTIETLLDDFHHMQSISLEEDPRLRRRQLGSENGVVVMTTHMSKGLEFEFVFALGMASRTTQKDLVEPEGLDKVGEKMRQFYVALTRAKRRVYLPCVVDASGAEISREEAAPAEIYLSAVTGREIFTLPEVQEALSAISHEVVNEKRDVVVQKTAACDLIPPKSVSLVFPEKMTLSFTALAKTQEGEKKEAPDDVLPLGAMTGIIFHAILEKAIDRGIYLDREKLQAYVEHEVHGTHLDGHKKEVFELIDTAFSTPLGLFCLRDVDPSQMLTEGAFCYEKNAQVEIKGFADLVFCHNGKYHLVDWKTNYLGQQREDYAIEKLEREMERHDYFLQSRIYSEAIKKHLNVIETRPYEEIFGSAHYIFLRGLKWNGYGTLSFSPEIATVETL